jgi:hypothetical protein
MTVANNQTASDQSLDFSKAFFHIPIGAASPLWMAYMGAASAGAAYWWFSRLSRYTHLESVMATEALVETPFAEIAPQPVMAEPEIAPAEVALEAVEMVVPEPVVPEPVAPAPVIKAAKALPIKAASPTVRAKTASPAKKPATRKPKV